MSTPALADEIDYKDYYSSEIVIDKNEDKNEWIVLDEKNEQSFLLNETEEIMYVNAGLGLNVRSTPTTDSIPVSTLQYGEDVKVIGSKAEANDNEWVLIEYDSNYAFVWGKYLVEDAPVMNPSISDYDNYNSSNVNSSSSNMTYLGNFMITAYEWTGSPCANGNYPSEGYTVACDSQTLPLGARVYIEGVGERVVEDRGGGGTGWFDLYLGDESACWDWGVKYRDVYLIN